MTESKSCLAVIANELVICFMVHFDANMIRHKHVWILNRWCDYFSCALLRCDYEQILFCNYYNELLIRFMAHFDANILHHKHIWILNRQCDYFSCALLRCDCEQILLCDDSKWTCNSSHFRLDVTFVIQRTPWPRIDDEVSLVILKTHVLRDLHFYSIHIKFFL